MPEIDKLHAVESLLFDYRLQRHSVTSKKPPSGDRVNDSQRNSIDDIQIALAPDVQSYLNKTGGKKLCCNFVVPIAFERADPKSWFNPKFDSPALEEQYLISLFPHMRMLYRFTLSYILITTIVWFMYFWLGHFSLSSWTSLLLPALILAIMSLIALLFTNTVMYRNHHHATSVVTCIVICAAGISILCFTGNLFSPLGHFALCLEIILLIYSGLPMILWIRAVVAISYSIIFETLSSFVPGTLGVHGTDPLYYNKVLTIRILLQFSVHLMASHVVLMKTVRMRGTFMKMGQNLLVRRQLEMEKQLYEKMIHSVMPPKVADMLLNEDGTDHADVRSKYMRPRSSSIHHDVKSLFRPFHIRRMNNVSILFADIVGFTAMASKKTAEQLVEVLNDLFERYDNLCTFNGCEKISTLGDCYYCVSGCPEPRPDHAHCCVELGLDMIYAMRYLEAQRHEGIKMRVGIHTGTVFFGIVGTRRVKFDVWSNDVTLADLIQYTGKPGLVRISEATLNHLGGAYLVEEGEKVMGQRSYFVMGRKKEKPRNKGLSPSPNLLLANYQQSLSHLSIHPKNPPNSPDDQISTSVYPTPMFLSLKLQVRSRSINAADTFTNNNSAKSLPDSSVLDQEDLSSTGDNRERITTPETEEKNTWTRLENWSLPHFLRKIDDFRRTAPSKDLVNSRTFQPPPDGTAATVEQNGYQQIPLLMETTNPTCTINIPQTQGHTSPSTEIKIPDGSFFSSDIRSYISHSGAPSPFVVSGSYRSQNVRSGQEECHCLDTPPELEDSGTKSTNRRPSVQQQIFALNQAAAISHRRLSGYRTSLDQAAPISHRRLSGYRTSLDQAAAISDRRLSGYRTNSASSIDIDVPGTPYHSYLETPMTPEHAVSLSVANPLEHYLQNLKKQSDILFIRCVRDNAKSNERHILQPPLKRCTLFFKSEEMEREFRSKAHRGGIENEIEYRPTLATPRYNTYLDIFVVIVVYFCVATSLLLMVPNCVKYNSYVVIFSLFTAIQFFALVYLSCRDRTNSTQQQHSYGNRIYKAISSWYPWHICLGILMAMPVALVILHYSLLDLNSLATFEYHYGFLIFVCIVQFCNFTQLNSWMRNILALLTAIVFLVIAYSHIIDINPMETMVKRLTAESKMIKFYSYEVIVDLLLLLILVWMLNRELEIGYRLTFFSNAVVRQDKIRVQTMKNQAEMLLHNIMPNYVAEHLKNTAKYSENHRNVAIIFASIVNFSKIYDESYLGGREHLRVLNEIIGDFDELLTHPEFQSVEKIKTIGSTFMAASGLDPQYRCVKNHHINALMEFSKCMLLVVNSFNSDLLEFELVLQIGFNVGDVTAGVIGTSKLHYDIWGDAVNVASRMTSTGVSSKIQLRKACLPYLEDRYEFESRGEIYVKGKGIMEVFLYKADKPYSAENDCGNECGLQNL